MAGNDVAMDDLWDDLGVTENPYYHRVYAGGKPDMVGSELGTSTDDWLTEIIDGRANENRNCYNEGGRFLAACVHKVLATTTTTPSKCGVISFNNWAARPDAILVGTPTLVVELKTQWGTTPQHRAVQGAQCLFQLLAYNHGTSKPTRPVLVRAQVPYQPKVVTVPVTVYSGDPTVVKAFLNYAAGAWQEKSMTDVVTAIASVVADLVGGNERNFVSILRATGQQGAGTFDESTQGVLHSAWAMAINKASPNDAHLFEIHDGVVKRGHAGRLLIDDLHDTPISPHTLPRKLYYGAHRCTLTRNWRPLFVGPSKVVNGIRTCVWVAEQDSNILTRVTDFQLGRSLYVNNQLVPTVTNGQIESAFSAAAISSDWSAI